MPFINQKTSCDIPRGCLRQCTKNIVKVSLKYLKQEPNCGTYYVHEGDDFALRTNSVQRN